jgi:hypothetical protein
MNPMSDLRFELYPKGGQPYHSFIGVTPDLTYSGPPKVGVTLAVAGNPSFLHLHLASLRRYCGDLPVLVHDDCSADRGELLRLCREYNADFQTSNRHVGGVTNGYHGDLAAMYGGIAWGERNGLDLVVKFSRRFVPLHNWLPGLSDLAERTQGLTFSNVSKFVHLQFRTDCFAVHPATWVKVGALAQLEYWMRRQDPFHPEPRMHEIAKLVERFGSREYNRQRHNNPVEGYVAWPMMGDHTEPFNGSVVHRGHGVMNFLSASQTLGLPYGADDFRINIRHQEAYDDLPPELRPPKG